jgi:fructose-1,6-bisphosphatase I
MASEENADIIPVSDHFGRGDYILVFDPLDGSSNIDVNINVGTIFSIHKRLYGSKPDPSIDDVLQQGSKQVGAGYFLYGPSTMMVYTTGQGVNAFTLDPSVGEFLLSHPNIQIPETGRIYSVNEGNYALWDEKTRTAINYFKGSDNRIGQPYSLRYVGSLVADFHRTLLYGGIFAYPKSYKKPTRGEGKLRLLCEAAPLSFVAEQAGGRASDGTGRILEIEPESLHQRVPLFIGSKNDVEDVARFLA